MKMEKVLRSALLLLLAAALCLSMAACTQTPAESSPASETQTPETAASEKASPEDDIPEDAGTEETPASDALSSALPVKTLRAKRVDENPYMAKSDANIHHDGYNTDSTDEVLPLGIYPEINVSYEKTNANASPAIYFDNYGHAVVPLLGGIAIRDLNAEEATTLGYFSPKQHDGGGDVIQSSYTFLDSENRIVCPTSNNHVLMLRATDENGNVLDVYTVDPKTGTGTDSSNAEVNLPQTGNNSMTNWLLCVGAALFMAFGFGAVKASGILKRKEDE